MGHMSGLRRADGGGETIEEGEGGLLFCPSCELIETTVSSVDRARTNGIFDVERKEGKFVANWMEIWVIRLAMCRVDDCWITLISSVVCFAKPHRIASYR